MENVYKKIKGAAKKYHIDKIVLFGSRARGDNADKSDIDIAVYFSNGCAEKERAAFRLEITEDLPTLYSIDVVCVDGQTDEHLLKNIAEDGVVIYMKERKFDQYKKAVAKIKEASEAYSKSGDELIRDALIQRFEFTFELAWKTIKEYLTDQGVSDDISFPKSVLKKAFTANIIDDEKWLDMLDDRNMTAHIYNEKIAAAISSRIQTSYVELFEKLTENMEDLYGKSDSVRRPYRKP